VRASVVVDVGLRFAPQIGRPPQPQWGPLALEADISCKSSFAAERTSRLSGSRLFWGQKPARNRVTIAPSYGCMPYAARTLPRNSSTALRSMPDCVSSSRAFASTSDAALPVAAAAVVTPPIWLEISFDPAATD
jgi:hypothetical protein